MEFITGVTKKDTCEISDILQNSLSGSVKMDGAIHTIRDMGEFAFIVIRKREGLVQCVYEEGISEFHIQDLREGMTVITEGHLHAEERAPYGFEVRLTSITILSSPQEGSTMPIPISKWKMKTSLETKLAYRPISLRNIRERAIFKLQEKYERKIRNPYDLEPEEEVLIGKYFKEEYGCDFVFVTHYPSKKRPFYAMDDPADNKFTLSFDLLFRGMEITTGGQRIHDYEEQVKKMEARGMDCSEFSNFLMIHKHGMPPHGGLGLGLERFTMKLIDEQNVREATLFPRDLSRLEP